MSLARILRTLVHLRPSQPLWRLWYRARLPLFRTRFYSRTLIGATAASLPGRFPPPLWPGDAENGRRLLAGSIRLLGADMQFGQFPDWHHPWQTHLWRFTLNYFEWLADLRALDGPEARARARDLVGDWWDIHHDLVDPEGWHPYPLSLRLVSWLSHGEWLLDGAGPEFKAKFAAALDAQARHLGRVVERDVGGNHIVKNLKALAMAAAFLPGHGARLAPALAELRRELARQILPDGGHYERSPAYHVQVLADLVELRATLPSTPNWLDESIGRMSAALQALRHGDGGLAQFNDGDEGEPRLLAALDATLAPLPPAPAALPDSGYFRLARQELLVIMDAGKCCPDDLPAHAHADTLSFELSEAGQRIVVNCGTFGYQEPAWRSRLRGTASASTIGIDDLDSAEIYGVFRLGRRPRHVMAQARPDSVTASHDGWRHLGIDHERRLELTPSALAGRDVVTRAEGRRITARFHLHPSVVPTMDGTAIMLGAGSSRWRFTAQGGDARLEPSVYSPRFGIMVETIQITVTAAGAASSILSWRFDRIH